MDGRASYDHTRRIAFVFGSVLLIATIALGVMRLGLAGTTTVLALLDRATLGVDVVQLAICEESLVRRAIEPNAEATYRHGCSRSLGDP